MLILSRKAGESLILDGGIEIKITEIYGDKVRIGIDAPGSVKVYRKELYATIKENQSAAAHTPAAAVKDLLKRMHRPENSDAPAPEQKPGEGAKEAKEPEKPETPEKPGE